MIALIVVFVAGLPVAETPAWVFYDGRARTHYMRRVIRADTAVGVALVGSIPVWFAPPYEHATLHTLTVTHRGVTTDRRKSVLVLSAHQAPSQALFDGSKTETIVLDDVRVGDVADIAFSVCRENPQVGTHVSEAFTFSTSLPTELAHFSVTVPKRVKTVVQPQGMFPDPLITENDQGTRGPFSHRAVGSDGSGGGKVR